MRVGPGADNDPKRKLSFTFEGQAITGLPGDTIASALMAAEDLVLGPSQKIARKRGLRWLDRACEIAVTVSGGAHGPDGSDPTRIRLTDGMVVKRRARAPNLPKLLGAREIAAQVLIIGGGVAGLMAARTAGRAGATVILAEAAPSFGGALLGSDEALGGMPARAWLASILAELAASDNIQLMPGTRIEERAENGWLARRHGAADGPADDVLITAPSVILASGAVERMIAFEGNDLPGVMTASTLRATLHRWGTLPGKRIAIFGISPEVRQTAEALRRNGLDPVAIIDAGGRRFDPDNLANFAGGVIRRAHGFDQLEAISVIHEGGSTNVACDGLAIAGGWSPSILIPGLDIVPIWNPKIAAWLMPPGATPGFETAGAAGGSFSTRAAIKSGYFRARRALAALDIPPPLSDLPEAVDQSCEGEPLWYVPGGEPDETFLDFTRDRTLSAARGKGAPAKPAIDAATAREFLANPVAG